MRAAIVHHHLGEGGVAAVIARASGALAAAGVRHVVLTADDGRPGLPCRKVDGLGYLADAAGLTADQLVDAMRREAAGALGGPPDLWHFHNHSLGKNVLLAEVVEILAAAGERLVLQIHDLAEDGRPQNHPAIAGHADLYPVSGRITYAFLNSHDHGRFISAGLPAGNAVLLPNPIAPANSPPPPAGPALLFAPVRGIRRKNLGELLLLATLAPAGTRLAVSRAPADRAIHDAWHRFAAELGLPIRFDVSGRVPPHPEADPSFESWRDASSHFVTTSLAEGFGLPFLEAPAHGRPLVGRKLPSIAADHARHGIRFGSLYDALEVPISWVPGFEHRHPIQFQNHHRAYGIAPPELPAWDDDWIDFGRLDEAAQGCVLLRLADPARRAMPRVRIDAATQPAAAWLAAAIARRTPDVPPDRLAPWSPDAFSSSLTGLYQQLMDAPDRPQPALDPSRILAACLEPAAFRPLLSLPPPPVRAVVFDLYGTLLLAPAGGVKPDPAADPVLREILARAGHIPPDSPSTLLHQAVLRHHAAAGVPHPEVDLRELWRGILSLSPGTDTRALVRELEAAWHPARWMPGAESMLARLARLGLPLGIVSNAQCNASDALGPFFARFAPDLTLLSYQQGVAKPDPRLFRQLALALERRGIPPQHALFVGNDPLHDIAPAASAGFQTALFTGHPEALRPGHAVPDHRLEHWDDLAAIVC